MLAALNHPNNAAIYGLISRGGPTRRWTVVCVSAGGALKVRVMAVPVTTTPAFSAGTPRVLFEGPFRIDGGSFRNYDVTADGQRFVMVQEVERPPARVSQMELVQNWVEELKQRVSVKK